ncbi:PqiC family protein [Verrucomicrobiaceae bacterium 227]
MLKPALFLAALLALTSCSSQRNFYVLSPAGKAPASGGTGIGVGPVDVANYLTERPYIVFQSSPNKMEISDLHEWAGDLSDDISRVLATDLGRHKNTGNVRTYPWDHEGDLDYQIAIDIRQFHGTADGDAILEASWRVYRLPESRLVTSKTTTLHEPLQGDGFEALVAAQSRLIDKLAATIAKQL